MECSNIILTIVNWLNLNQNFPNAFRKFLHYNRREAATISSQIDGNGGWLNCGSWDLNCMPCLPFHGFTAAINININDGCAIGYLNKFFIVLNIFAKQISVCSKCFFPSQFNQLNYSSGSCSQKQ